MPIYEYRCQFCGEELEKLQRMSDDPLRDCPACGTAGLRRLISAAGFRLKGSGWYETDFKQDNRRNVLESDGDGAKAGDKKDAAGKDSGAAKPAKEKDAKTTKTPSANKQGAA